jgi:hypothetical protein
MAREESSVMSSLQDLMTEEDRRRTEQVALAHRRKLEQVREVLEQQTRRSEEERQRSEAAKREALARAARERAEHERRERETHLDAERLRADLELRAKVTLMQTEQQQELERLALVRDRRVSQLEGQRWMLASLLGTLLIGLTLVYALVIRTQANRMEQTIAQLTTENFAMRTEQKLERNRLEARIVDFETQVSALRAELATARSNVARAEPGRGAKPAAPARMKPPVAPKPICDDNDPLCGRLGAG